MFSKSFSVDGWDCVPSLILDLRPNFPGGNEDNITSFKRSLAGSDSLSAPTCRRPPRPTPLLEIPRYFQATLGQSLVGSLLLSPGSWGAQGFI